MREKTHLFFLFLAIGVAILVPAIEYGKASLVTAEPANQISEVSAEHLYTTLPPSKETAVNIETLPAPDKKTAKPSATAPKKTPPKVLTLKKAVQKEVKKEIQKKVASVSAPAAPEITTSEPKTASCSISGFNEKFLCLINAHRVKNNKSPLAYDGELSATARLHSEWMDETGITSHTGEDGSKFYERCEARGTGCLAENIAMGFTSASHLFELWKNSPGHNANMLGDYSVIGLGVYGEHATTLFR